MAYLEALPNELILAIIGFLRPHDLTQLARVSRKFGVFAQSELWASIELHRRDAHHGQVGLNVQKTVQRAYLDDMLRERGSYRTPEGDDLDFDRRNILFGNLIRKVYATAGRTTAWMNLAPKIRHICLKVEDEPPPAIWNVILSLPNLTEVEIDGTAWCSPHPNGFRAPCANKIRHARLRRCIPASFITALCKASISTLVSLDIGTLEFPRSEYGISEDIDCEAYWDDVDYDDTKTVRWFLAPTMPTFQALKHLPLCRKGIHTTFLDMEELDIDSREDKNERIADLNQWACILKSTRNTIEQVVLEQRPVYKHYLVTVDPPAQSHLGMFQDICYYPGLDVEEMDLDFFRHVLKAMDDGGQWPKLSQITFRGINFTSFEKTMGESFDQFITRVLPAAQAKKVPDKRWDFRTFHRVLGLEYEESHTFIDVYDGIDWASAFCWHATGEIVDVETV